MGHAVHQHGARNGPAARAGLHQLLGGQLAFAVEVEGCGYGIFRQRARFAAEDKIRAEVRQVNIVLGTSVH